MRSYTATRFKKYLLRDYNTRKLVFQLEVDIALNVSVVELQKHLVDWAITGGGCRHPDDPLFDGVKRAEIRQLPELILPHKQGVHIVRIEYSDGTIVASSRTPKTRQHSAQD